MIQVNDQAEQRSSTSTRPTDGSPAKASTCPTLWPMTDAALSFGGMTGAINQHKESPLLELFRMEGFRWVGREDKEGVRGGGREEEVMKRGKNEREESNEDHGGETRTVRMAEASSL